MNITLNYQKNIKSLSTITARHVYILTLIVPKKYLFPINVGLYLKRSPDVNLIFRFIICNKLLLLIRSYKTNDRLLNILRLKMNFLKHHLIEILHYLSY